MRKRVWPVQDAKARFSELLDACERNGAQIVSRRGEETAVILPIEEWKRLRHAARPTIKALLLREDARIELSLPKRRQTTRRMPPSF